MRKKYYCLAVFMILILSILSGCSRDTVNMTEKEARTKTDNINNTVPIEGSGILDGILTENRNVYDGDEALDVAHLYVTILRENNIVNGKTVTLHDLNSYNYRMAEDSPKVEVIFQEGTSEGLAEGLLGYGAKEANASMEVRGHSSSMATQKSFKIRLYDKEGLWDGQNIINLNKHPKDLARVRNKLSFDYFKLIPNFTSLRTRFVNLHIKDLTANPQNTKFVDYGLFTHIEQPNKDFLRSHGLDPGGNLYKAENFEFFRYQDNIKLADDPAYDKKKFEERLTIKGSQDHRKLIEMLDDVNDYSKNINDVVDKHFNRDNMLTWIAINILLDNVDTNSQNFMLYRPSNSDKWYFLPWDCDAAWGYYSQLGSSSRVRPKWQRGLSNYWGMVLFNRFFRHPDNLLALNNKLDYLSKVINKEKTEELLGSYHDIVSHYVRRSPDIHYLPSDVSYFEAEYKRLSSEPEANLKEYYSELENPLPVHLGNPAFSKDRYVFFWSRSFDLQDDDISYSFEISTDPGFSNVVDRKEGLIDTSCEAKGLMPGIYYWRVLIRDSKGNEQIAFDNYRDDEGDKYPGIKQYVAKSIDNKSKQ